MAKIQTRRSISINGQLFVQVQRHCREQKISMSSYVTRLLAEDLDFERQPQPPPRRLSHASAPNVQTLPKRDPAPRRMSSKDPRDPFTF